MTWGREILEEARRIRAEARRLLSRLEAARKQWGRAVYKEYPWRAEAELRAAIEFAEAAEREVETHPSPRVRAMGGVYDAEAAARRLLESARHLLSRAEAEAKRFLGWVSSHAEELAREKARAATGSPGQGLPPDLRRLLGSPSEAARGLVELACSQGWDVCDVLKRYQSEAPELLAETVKPVIGDYVRYLYYKRLMENPGEGKYRPTARDVEELLDRIRRGLERAAARLRAREGTEAERLAREIHEAVREASSELRAVYRLANEVCRPTRPAAECPLGGVLGEARRLWDRLHGKLLNELTKAYAAYKSGEVGDEEYLDKLRSICGEARRALEEARKLAREAEERYREASSGEAAKAERLYREALSELSRCPAAMRDVCAGLRRALEAAYRTGAYGVVEDIAETIEAVLANVNRAAATA